MMDAAAALRHRLLALNSALAVRTLGDPVPMSRAARELESKFGEGRPPNLQAILTAVRGFLSSGDLPDFRSLKLVCYGLAQRPRPSAPCVLESERLTARLLAAVERLAASGALRQFRRCCQGLLSVYFTENPFTAAGQSLANGWARVRQFLERSVRRLFSADRTPDWAAALNDNANLLTANPCDKYGKSILEGEKDAFELVCERLGIPQTSWVREQVVVAVVQAACKLGDADFTHRINELLALLDKAKPFRPRGVALLLDRYAVNKQRPAHMALQSVATELFGNPLLQANGQKWASISGAAKQMVGDWLKEKVVEQFFELLTYDGATDKRRVRFWRSYATVIENMWLVLGPAAMSGSRKDFLELRKLMGDQALKLQGGSRTNNAFIMKIGRQYIVEFGEKGNAVYVYRENELPFDLRTRQPLDTSSQLKAGSRRLSHMDGHHPWEEKFRFELELGCPDAQAVAAAPARVSTGAPASRAAASPPAGQAAAMPADVERAIKRFCLEHGLRYVDNRARNGNLIVETDDMHTMMSAKLKQWGFRYDAPRSRWIKY